MRSLTILAAAIFYVILSNAIFYWLISSIFNTSTFAHNNSDLTIPIATEKITLDGQIKEKEWKDAFKINFTSPVSGKYVLYFLKYELTEKTLSGAFLTLIKPQFMM